MSKATLFKDMGWSIVVNPVNGDLFIYRADLPGEMVVSRTKTGYTTEIYAHADKLVASASATFDELECEE